MSFVMVGAALIGAGGAIYAGNQAADAQKDAVKAAGQQTQAGIAAQQATTRQQLELARPLVETRDSALNALQTLFGLPQTRASNIDGGSVGRGTNGSQLVALNGLSTTGQHSAQTNTNGPLGINTFGTTPLVPGSSPTKTAGAGGSPSLYYDPGSNTIVDGAGNLVYNVPEGGGIIEGLRHGYNNQVRIDANGNLTSVGSSGENPINIRLQRQAPGQAGQAGAGSATAGPSQDRQTLIDTLMQTPGIQFVDQQGRKELEQMLAARGLRNSGRAYAAGIQRASDLASTNYTNLVLNPLFQLAGFGQQGAAAAGGALAQQGQNATANSQTLANLALQGGNARASSYAQNGQVLGDLASNLAFIYERNGGFGGAAPKTGTMTTNKQPSSVTPLAGYTYNNPLAPNSLYDNVYGGN